MGHRYSRTPDHSARQKARTEKNRLKVPKSKKTASQEVIDRKLKTKELKRQRFLKENEKKSINK